MLSTHNLILNSLDDTNVLAAALADTMLSGIKLLTLKGDLGSGKTTICRQIIRRLAGAEQQINSPTFNILQIYQSTHGSIYHYDLYRVKNGNELYELNIDEACSGEICLIEWPEIALPLLPSYRIDLEIAGSGDVRQVSINLPHQYDQFMRRLS